MITITKRLFLDSLAKNSLLQLAIEYAVHGAIGDTLYIFLVARNTRSLFPELFVFDPWRLQCNRIASFAGSKDRVTSMCVSPQIPDQVPFIYSPCSPEKQSELTIISQHNLMTDTSIESNRFYQLLVIGTDGGSVHILRLCPDIFLREPDVPSAIVACKTQYVASLSIHVENTSISNGSTSDSAYIFVGGFNGEIEIITYGRLLDENEPKYGVQSSKVVTTLWKNSKHANTWTISVYSYILTFICKWLLRQWQFDHFKASQKRF